MYLKEILKIFLKKLQKVFTFNTICIILNTVKKGAVK